MRDPDQTLAANDASFDATLREVRDDTSPTGRLHPGDSVGRYLVVGELGSGGMGTVYAAYDPELDRRVALKLIHHASAASSTAGDGAARLLREAQAMARLNHPNVVIVHDVGVHRGGVFLAMEYVEGRTLGQWLRERSRTLPEVVRTFVAAGRGLAAAHAAGIVHRDFKPENVLVGTDGRIRVADFGVARSDAPAAEHASRHLVDDLTSGDPTGSADAHLTATGALMGTPAYMAPEQYAGRKVDARTDQFSFCVALHEALYGERPFAGDTLGALALAVTRGDLRDPPPTARVPAWLRRILLRGLSPRPEDRYPTIDALLAELGRDPAVTRRRAAMLLGVTLIAAVLGMSLSRSRGDAAARCLHAVDPIDAVWSGHRRNNIQRAFESTGLAYAREVASRTLANVDAFTREWKAQASANCEATHVRHEQSERLLDLRTSCLDASRRGLDQLLSLYERPDQTVVLNAIDALVRLGSPEACGQTERLLAAVPPPRDPEVVRKVADLRLELAANHALRAAGKYRDALEAAESLAQRVTSLDYEPLQAEMEFARAALHTALEHRTEAGAAAESAFRHALAVGDDRLAARAAYHMLWVTSPEGSDGREMDHWFGVSQALIRRIADDELEVDLLSNHSGALRRLQRFPEAVAAARRGLEIATRLHGEDSLEAAHILTNLAAAAHAAGDSVTARDASLRAHASWSRELGQDHPRTARALGNVAVYRLREGDLDGAASAMEQVLQIHERVYGKESSEYADTLSNLSVLHLTAGRYAEAERLQRQLVATYARLEGDSSVDVAQVRANLAVTLTELERYDEAISEAETALHLLEAKLGASHTHLPVTLTILAAARRESGRPGQARLDAARALEIVTKIHGEDNPRAVPALLELAYDAVDERTWELAARYLARVEQISAASPLDAEQALLLDLLSAEVAWNSAGDRGGARQRLSERLRTSSTALPRLRARAQAWLADHEEP